jgi:hypothetical protein
MEEEFVFDESFGGLEFDNKRKNKNAYILIY